MRGKSPATGRGSPGGHPELEHSDFSGTSSTHTFMCCIHVRGNAVTSAWILMYVFFSQLVTVCSVNFVGFLASGSGPLLHIQNGVGVKVVDFHL